MNAGRIALGAMVAFSAACLVMLILLALLPSGDGMAQANDLGAGTVNPGQNVGTGMKCSVDFSRARPGSQDLAVVQVLTAGKTVSYNVEIADSPAAIARGLMYRTDLAPDAGMLFVFGSDANRYFWMKDTLIPLDLIYLSGDGRVVGIRENAVPRSTRTIRPPGPCRYVLEVNGGQCRRQGIGAGDRTTMGPA